MSEQKNDLYVGYVALPKHLRSTIAALVLLLAALIALDAWLVATLQPPAGDGRWAETPTTFEGTLVRDPYPALLVTKDGVTKTYIVISDEKRSAEAALEKFANGTTVKLEGYEIERAAVGMIQLAATDMAPGTAAPVATPPREIHGRMTIEGEIVDSKCWLGVMRPGDGHIHKACASLCIRGGIPPMFVTRGQNVPPVMLLTTSDGSAIQPEHILDYIADAVELSGVIEKRGDISVFKVDLATLKRAE